MSSNPYRPSYDRQSSSDMSTVDLSSSSSLHLNHPQEAIEIRRHHKLRSSPKCSPLRPHDDDYTTSREPRHCKRRVYEASTSSYDGLPHHDHQLSPESQSWITIHSSSRLYTYIFLLFAAFALVHAIFSGFENRHDARQSYMDNNHSSSVDKLQASTIVSEQDEAVLLNNRMKYDNRSTNERNYNENRATSEPTATVLSRTSQLSYLISNLGAGDVVECYVVTRMAQLSSVVSTVPLGNRNLDSTDGNTNSQQQESIPAASTSTTSSNPAPAPILIRKSGLAFRYRPRVASAPNTNSQTPQTPNTPKYFELTLEYGPQRTGVTKSYESLPTLHVDTESESTSKYVSWQNEGRVYHTTSISSEWTEAYYMAPITGVVLEKILQRAVDYTQKRPRYQPFEVVSVPSGKMIVRSSGSDDFVWEMFRDLADLYVEIDPILVPPRGRLQFYVADVEQHNVEGESQSKTSGREPNPNVQRVKGGIEVGRAALFYERFYNCANAIKTGDYSLYLPPVTAEPTAAPSVHMTALPSSAPTDHGTDFSKEETLNTTTVENDVDDDILNNLETSSTEGKSAVHVVKFNETVVADGDALTENTAHAEGDDKSFVNATNATQIITNDTDSNRTRFMATEDEIIASPGLQSQPNEIENSNSTLDELNNSTLEAEEDEGDVAEAAEKLQQAAVEAAQAAVEAASKNSSAADSAAAASQAAEAAKKAADATTAARNKIQSEGLISGDGALATQILSACFSDPKYGIAQKDEVMKSSTAMNRTENYDDTFDNSERVTDEIVKTRQSAFAYIYLDGDTYFRLNLTAPYWGTAASFQTVPQPNLKPEGWGDAVDWAICIFILLTALFGFLVMCHQGGCVYLDKRLRFHWFFKPTEHDKVDSADEFYFNEAEKNALQRGGGFAHTIGIDAIPTSMGGKLSHYTDKIESGSSTADDDSTGVLLEMTHQRSESGNGVTPGRGDNLPCSLRIRRDNPDQVQRPSAMTASKPAIPQQSPRDDEDCANGDEIMQEFVHNANNIIAPPFS